MDIKMNISLFIMVYVGKLHCSFLNCLLSSPVCLHTNVVFHHGVLTAEHASEFIAETPKQEISPPNGYSLHEKTIQVNNKKANLPSSCVIIWLCAKCPAEASRGIDICGGWLSEPASEVSDSI